MRKTPQKPGFFDEGSKLSRVSSRDTAKAGHLGPDLDRHIGHPRTRRPDRSVTRPKELLLEQSVTEVALAVGFAEISSF